MKKYDFTKYELWFSRSALQLLACAERTGFIRHIKRVQRFENVGEGSIDWQQDEIYLPRMEKNRNVCRKTIIFDLDTSRKIMDRYSKNTPKDYQAILERFVELVKLRREERIDSLKLEMKKRGFSLEYYDFGNMDSDAIENLEIMVYPIDREVIKQRIVVDARCGVFAQVIEGRNKDNKGMLLRPLFRTMAGMPIFKKQLS